MYKGLNLLIAFLLLWGAELFAQKEQIVGWYMPAIMSAKQPQARIANDPLLIPFLRSGNLILIEAVVDDQTGYFILDTGAPYLVLNRTYFRDYPSIANYTALGISNLEVDIIRTQVDSLRIRNLSYHLVEADVADLSHLENSRNLKILGLLGTNLFNQFVLGIDFKAQNISIESPEHFQKKHNYKSLSRVPFALKNDMILLSGKINNKRVSLVFDTGAEINVLDYDLDDEVYEFFKIERRSTLSGSVGESIEVYSGVLTKTVINESNFHNMKTIMTNLSGIGKVYGFRVDGILGYEFLAKTPVFIDFNRKEILIQKKDFYE